MKTCEYCQGEIPEWSVDCPSWSCLVGQTKKDGGKVHSPNGLPVSCVKADGSMYEHEHGDHPDYKFPVEVVYVGEIADSIFEEYIIVGGSPTSEEQDVRNYLGQTHALIYSDNAVALTLYECTYALWLLRSGNLASSSNKALFKDMKLSEESIALIRERQQS